jgi:hypothetical protein
VIALLEVFFYNVRHGCASLANVGGRQILSRGWRRLDALVKCSRHRCEQQSANIESKHPYNPNDNRTDCSFTTFEVKEPS